MQTEANTVVHRRAVVAVSILVMLLMVPVIQGSSGGIYNRASGCNCHSQAGSNAASVTISGLPSSYDANNQYQLTVAVSGGVSGSGGGFSLEVNKGTLNTGTAGTLVKVNNQGKSATHTSTGNGYRSWTVDWTAPTVGAGSVTFEVAGMTTNGNGGTSGDRWATTVIQVSESVAPNNPPSATSVSLDPTLATTTNSLTLSYSFTDPDNDAESDSEITWYRNSQALPQGTITGLTVPSGQTAKGEDWYATVRPSDGTDYGNIEYSNTVTIINSPPTLTSPTITPSEPDETDDLTVIYSANDDDQDTLSTEIRWYLDGVLVAEFNDDNIIPSIATRDGDEWRVEVTVSDGDDVKSLSSQVITVGGIIQVNTAPEVTSIGISPDAPTTVDELQVSYVAQDLDNDPIIDTEVEWFVDDVLTDLTGFVIASSETEKGQNWEAKIRVYDGKDWSAWASSSASIINTPPEVESVTLTPSEVFTDDSIFVDYQSSDLDGDVASMPQIIWLKNGVEQTQFEGLNPLPAEYIAKDDIWTAMVKASDGESYSVTGLESSVTVQNSLPTLSINEIPDNLSLVNSDSLGVEITPEFTDLDDDMIDYTIHWLRNGFREGSLDNDTFVGAELFGAGQIWTLAIYYDDNDGPQQQFTKTIEIDNLPPTANIEVLSADLWRGEIISLSASQSSDLDGVINNYLWQYSDSEGNSGTATGSNVEITGFGNIEVILTVEDDLGLTNTATTNLITTQGPRVTGLTAVNINDGVELLWQWSGDDTTFIVLRNGEQIGTTSGFTFVDKPVIAGPTSYTITPVIDERELSAGSMTLTDFDVNISLELDSSVSESGGLILGILFLISSVAVISLALLQRRE